MPTSFQIHPEPILTEQSERQLYAQHDSDDSDVVGARPKVGLGRAGDFHWARPFETDPSQKEDGDTRTYHPEPGGTPCSTRAASLTPKPATMATPPHLDT